MHVRVFHRFSIGILFLIAPVAALVSSESAQPATALIKTALGELTVRLDWKNAPGNSKAFVRYVSMGMYDKTTFTELDELTLHGGEPSRAYPGIARNGNMSAADAPPGEFQLPNKKFAVGFRRTVGSCNPEKRSNCTQIYIPLADKPGNDGEFTTRSTLSGSIFTVDGRFAGGASTRNPGIAASLSSVPPESPRPRPLIIGT